MGGVEAAQAVSPLRRRMIEDGRYPPAPAICLYELAGTNALASVQLRISGLTTNQKNASKYRRKSRSELISATRTRGGLQGRLCQSVIR